MNSQQIVEAAKALNRITMGYNSDLGRKRLIESGLSGDVSKAGQLAAELQRISEREGFRNGGIAARKALAALAES